MKNTSLLFFLISFLTASPLVAQQPSKKMIAQMTVTVTSRVKENYVLPDRGEQIAKGRFYQAKTLKQLDSIMCKSPHEVSNESHLLFQYASSKLCTFSP